MPEVGNVKEQVMSKLRQGVGFDVNASIVPAQGSLTQKLYDPGTQSHEAVQGIVAFQMQGSANAQRHMADLAFHAGVSKNFVVGSIGGQLAVGFRDVPGGQTALAAAEKFGEQVGLDAQAAGKSAADFIKGKIGSEISAATAAPKPPQTQR